MSYVALGHGDPCGPGEVPHPDGGCVCDDGFVRNAWGGCTSPDDVDMLPAEKRAICATQGEGWAFDETRNLCVHHVACPAGTVDTGEECVIAPVPIWQASGIVVAAMVLGGLATWALIRR